MGDLNRSGKASLRRWHSSRDMNDMQEKGLPISGKISFLKQGQISTSALSGSILGCSKNGKESAWRKEWWELALEEVSGASHLKLRGVLKALILFYWRLETFGRFSIRERQDQISILNFGLSVRRETREDEVVHWQCRMGWGRLWWSRRV